MIFSLEQQVLAYRVRCHLRRRRRRRLHSQFGGIFAIFLLIVYSVRKMDINVVDSMRRREHNSHSHRFDVKK